MNIKDMVLAQKQIKMLIDNSYKNDRLNHAYLLYGDDGVGKKEMALYFACKIYCPNGGCMECSVCKNIINGEHLNVNIIGLLDNKKLLSKEQITDLQEEYSRTSLVNGARIYIVDGIDTASVAAQNSLLKFIEEPQNQEETYGIFIARDKTKVVSTIQSRCNLIYFPTLDKKNLIASITDIPLEKKVMLSYLTNSYEEIIKLNADEKLGNVIEQVYKFMEIKNSCGAILFYLNQNNILVDSYLSYFLRFLIIIHEDMIHDFYKEDLLFYPLHDKIEVYKERYSIAEIKTKLELLLELEKRINFNVISKNILHELVVKYYC